MKIVAYYRVSTKRQGHDGLGMDAQRHAVQNYLKATEATLIASFQEVETGKRNDRTQLAEALKLCRTDKARLVIAKLDRLSRNASFLLGLRDSGVDFVCCDMPDANRLTIGILAVVAEDERERISKRTKEALQVAKKRGKKLGNPSIGMINHLGRNAIAQRKSSFCQKSLLAIEDIKSTGITTLQGIANCLNKRGEKTARSKKWTPTAVRRVVLSS